MPSARLAQLNAEIRRCEMRLLQAEEEGDNNKDVLKQRLEEISNEIKKMNGAEGMWFFSYVK